MQQAGVTPDICPAVAACLKKAEETAAPAGAMVLPDGRVVTGKNSSLLGPSAALLLNAIKALAGIDKELDLLPSSIIAPISDMKISHLGHRNPRLHSDEVLIALAISALTNPLADMARAQLGTLRGCDAHFSVIISEEDIKLYKRLGIHVTCAVLPCFSDFGCFPTAHFLTFPILFNQENTPFDKRRASCGKPPPPTAAKIVNF